MPRPVKKRCVCRLPENLAFYPERQCKMEEVLLSVDEYETVRLIDLEGYTQEECANQMQVARATVQGIYDTARHKIADALVNGKRLVISGGAYFLCGKYTSGCAGCQKRCGKKKTI